MESDMALIFMVGFAPKFAVVEDSVFTADDREHFAKGGMINSDIWKRVTAHPSFQRLELGMGSSLPRPVKYYHVSEFMVDL